MALSILNFQENSQIAVGQTIFLDTSGDAQVVLGTGNLRYLFVELSGFSGTTAFENLGISQAGAVSLSNGTQNASTISINGVVIGQISGRTGSQFRVNFNASATPEHLQELLHALTYTYTSTAPLVAEQRSIFLTLVDTNLSSASASHLIQMAPDNAVRLVSGTDVSGTAGDDIFIADTSTQSMRLSGGDGQDTLCFVGGGMCYLDGHGFSALSGIETVRGSSQNDNLSVNEANFAGISVFDAGPNPEASNDIIALYGASFDFTGKTILNFDKIYIQTQLCEVTVTDKATALLFSGANVQGEHLTLKGATFSDAERTALHAAGIDRITDDNGTTGNQFPVMTGLDGSRVAVAAGQTVLLDQGQQFHLTDDGKLNSIELLNAGLRTGDVLGIDTTGSISLSDGAKQNSTVFVDNVAIGTITAIGAYKLVVQFNDNATADRIGELVHAFTYANPDVPVIPEHTLRIRVVDSGALWADSFVTVYHVNSAIQSFTLGTDSVAELSASGTVVGRLNAIDPDGDNLTYELLNNAGGRFKLGADGESIVVANGSLLDFEQAQAHTIRVKVSDGKGSVIEGDMIVHIADVSVEKAHGDAGANIFVGGSGSDTFHGGSGNDTLTGGAGQDVFVFNTALGTSRTNKQLNDDTIVDFTVKQDKIWLDNAIFTKLGRKGSEASPAKLKKDFFVVNTKDKAKDGNDYLVYNKKTGKLFYDPDGSGSKKPIEIAQLTKNLKLSYLDFGII